MPISSTQGKSEFIHFIDKIKPASLLDIGAGKGIYGTLARIAHEVAVIDAVEAWEPYITEYNLHDIYNNVYNVDVRDVEDFAYDVVVFGDVLEHMTKEEALAVWDRCSKEATHAIISIPIVHYPQGHLHGNPYEEHVKDDWTALEVINSFHSIYKMEVFDVVGVFYARFDGDRE